MLLFRVLALTTSIVGTTPFYLPGLAPVTYCSDTKSTNCKSDVPVYVNRLYSLSRILPYDYDKFDLCRDEGEEKSPTLNIGQVVFGERIKSSPYKLTFLKDVSCQKVCEKTYSPNNTESLKKLNYMRESIELNYNQNWIIDNMPVTWCFMTAGGSEYCSRSLPLGCFVTEEGTKRDGCVMDSRFWELNTYYFFNHIDLTITYHPEQSENQGATNAVSGRILSAKFQPKSVGYDADAVGSEMCHHKRNDVMGIRGGKLEKETTVRYTFSVNWQENSTIRWSSRWNYILDNIPHTDVMVFSTINSCVVVVALIAVVVKIAIKSLSKNKSENKKSTSCCRPKKTDNSLNWKLINGDVYRPPNCEMLFAVLNGSGVQVFLTALITLGTLYICLYYTAVKGKKFMTVFACLGFLSAANRGALETCSLISFFCFGFPAGYCSSRLYKAFGGEKKLLTALLTAMACPGIVFILAMMLNLVFWIEGSSAALPYTTTFALLGMWLGVSLPLTLLGSFFGFRKKTIKQPVKTDPTPRHVPKLRFYLKPLAGMIIGGILPYGCIFIQTFFILNSIWSHQVYYTFGFLSLTFLLMVVSCALVTIILCYFHLCAEDYRWWWRSFLNSSFTSVYFFLYGILYYVNKLELQGSVSAFLYFGYMAIAAFLIFLLTGFIGFFSCFLFVRKIYGSIKGHEMWSTTT